MALWRPKTRSPAPLGAVWRALGRHNYGVDHYVDDRGWVLEIRRLVRRRDHFEIVMTKTVVSRDGDDIDVIVQALPDLPGLVTRLALLEMIL